MPIKVIVDSNFLLAPAQLQIDIFEGVSELLGRKIEFVIPSPVYDELKSLSKRGEKMRMEASLALKLAEKCKIIDVKLRENENVDDLIVRLAIEWNCPVATNDRELKRKLRKRGIPIIFVREMKRIQLEGEV